METTTLLIIAGAAILISILSIILNFVLYGKVKRYLSDNSTDNGIDGRGTIRDEIVSVVLGSARVRSTLPKPQVIRDTVQATSEISTETFNFIVETVLAEVTKKQPREELRVLLLLSLSFSSFTYGAFSLHLLYSKNISTLTLYTLCSQ